MPRSRRDRTTGLPIPSPVVPATSICFLLEVPNALEYRAALKGALSDLGKSWTWAQTVGEDNEDAFIAAELWRGRLADAAYQLDCEAEMSCADVANCIETDASVRDAIAQQIAANPANQTSIYQTSIYGAPLTGAQRSAPLAQPPACDLDILFAMSTAIIDQIHLNNQDFLEILEVALNPTERARNVISAIPGIGLLPLDEAIEFINQLASEIQENYDAQWTSAVRDDLRCALFCAAKDAPDCIITFDMLTAIFEDRLNYYLDPINTAAAIVQYFVSATWAGTTVVDIMSLIQVAFWREASNWLGVDIRTLQIVARLVIDNPDPDWEILCTECAVPPTEDCYDFTASEQGFSPWLHPFSGLAAATYTAQGWDTGYNAGFAAIIREISGTIIGVTVRLAEATPTDTNVLVQVFNLALTDGATSTIGGLAEYVFTGLSISSGLYVNVQTDTAWASGQRIIEVCVELAEP